MLAGQGEKRLPINFNRIALPGYAVTQAQGRAIGCAIRLWIRRRENGKKVPLERGAFSHFGGMRTEVPTSGSSRPLAIRYAAGSQSDTLPNRRSIKHYARTLARNPPIRDGQSAILTLRISRVQKSRKSDKRDVLFKTR